MSVPNSGEEILRLAAVIDRQRRELDRLRSAAAARSVIDMAKGALIERLGCTAAEAASQLTALADEAGYPVAEIAAAIISEDLAGQPGEPADPELSGAGTGSADAGPGGRAAARPQDGAAARPQDGAAARPQDGAAARPQDGRARPQAGTRPRTVQRPGRRTARRPGRRTARRPGWRTLGCATSWPGRPLSWPPTAAKSRPPCWIRRWPRSGRPPSRCG